MSSRCKDPEAREKWVYSKSGKECLTSGCLEHTGEGLAHGAGIDQEESTPGRQVSKGNRVSQEQRLWDKPAWIES